MADTVDRLDIEIQAQAASAVAEVDKLYDALERVANVLNIATGSFTNAKTAIQGTARAMRSMAKISMPNLTTITQQMDALSQAGAGGSAISGVSSVFTVLSNTSNDANQAMSGLGGTASSVSDAFDGLMNVVSGVASGIGNVAQSIVSNFTLMGRAVTTFNRIKSSLTGILGALIGFYGVRSLVMLGKDAVELASDLTEVQNVVDHAFGLEGAKAVETFVGTSKEQYGLAELAAKQYSSRFQAMGKSMGITADMVAKAHDNVRDHMVQAYQDTGDEMGAMALNLTKLTADMASFYNEDQAHVAQALQSVFTGQTRSLRQYGIDLTQVNLQEWAAKQGIDAKIDSMTQAEKAMLRYQYIMAQTSMVQGDFARTADTWANQIRLLKQNFQALGSVIGGVVINVFKPLITWLNNAMSSVIAFAETIANALGKIFGWTIRGTAGGGGGEAGLGDLSGGLEDVGDAADGAGGSLGNANKEAKELKRTLLGFDEINKLNAVSDPSSGSGGSGGGGSGGGGAGGGGGATAGDFTLVKTESIFDQYKSEIDNLYELGGYISDVLTNTLKKINWDKVYAVADGFGFGLARFLNGLITPELFSEVGKTVAGSLNVALRILNRFGTTFDWKNFGASLGAGLQSFLSTYDLNLEASNFNTFVNGILTAASEAVGTVDWYGFGLKIRNAILLLDWKTILINTGEFIMRAINASLDLARGIFDGSPVEKAIEKLKNIVNTTIGKIDFKTLDEGFSKLVEALSPAVSGFADGLVTVFEGLAGVTAETINAIGIAVGDFADFVAKLDPKVVEAIGKALGVFVGGMIGFGLLSKVGGIISGFSSGLVGLISSLASHPIAAIGLSLGVLAAGIGSLTDSGFFSDADTKAAIENSNKIISNSKDVRTEVNNALDAIEAKDRDIESTYTAIGNMADEFFRLSGKSKLTNTEMERLNELREMLGGQLPGFTEIVSDTTKSYDDQKTAVNDLIAKTEDYYKTLAAEEYTKEYYKKLFDLQVQEQKLKEANEQLNASYQPMFDRSSLFGGILGTIADAFDGTNGKIEQNNYELKQNKEAQQKLTEQYRIQLGVVDQYKTKTGETTKAVSNAGASAGDLKREIQNLSKLNGANLKDNLGGAFDDIGSKASGAKEKTGNFGTGVTGFVGGIVAQTITMALMGTAYKNIGDKATEAQSPIEGLKTKISEMVSSISTNSSTAKKDSGTLASNITDTFSETIRGGADVAKKAAQEGMVTPTLACLQDGFGIHSPSTVMRDYGINLDQGLANGVTGSASLVTTALATMLATMKNSMTTFANSTKAIGTTAVTNFVSGLNSVAMPDLGKKARDSIDSTYTSAKGSFYTAGRDMANALKSGADSVGGFVNLGAEVKGAMGNYAKSGSSNPFYDIGKTIVSALNAGLKSEAIARLGYEKRTPQIISVGGKSQSVDTWIAKWYASGGFPNYGEVYVANEAGPEMIGKFGHKNVVANNQQITDGIKAAVIEGMMAVASAGAFGSSNDGTPLVLNATIKTPDGDVLARVVERAQARRDTRYYTTSIR